MVYLPSREQQILLPAQSNYFPENKTMEWVIFLLNAPEGERDE
jgi:hypothetical protein